MFPVWARAIRVPVSIAMAGAFLAPTQALADCAAESLAVSQIGFEMIPGDQLARQIHEARKSRAYSDLTACMMAERRAEREAERIEAERRQQASTQAAAAAQSYADSLVARQEEIAALRHKVLAERYKGAVSQAIIQGRCDDAKFVALNHGQLDLAEQAVRLCTPTKGKRIDSPPAPINPHSWIQPQDYPALALQEKRTGRVVVGFDVTAEGLVENCEIMSSSGHADLDRATCLFMPIRALFAPATNRNGEPVPGQSVRAVNWNIP